VFTGSSLGVSTQIGLEYFPAGRYSIFVGISDYYATIKKVKMNEGSAKYDLRLTKGKYEKNSNIDLKIGIRVYLWKELNR
jgi:hypothetical protein